MTKTRYTVQSFGPRVVKIVAGPRQTYVPAEPWRHVAENALARDLMRTGKLLWCAANLTFTPRCETCQRMAEGATQQFSLWEGATNG